MITTFWATPTLDRLSREMDRLFESATPLLPAIGSMLSPMAARNGSLPSAFVPGLNAWRENDAVIVEAELPGFRMEDLEISVVDNELTLRGKRSLERPEGATPLRVERMLTTFERTLRLPVEIDTAKAEATLRDGVLRVTLPITERARPRRIEVRPFTDSTARALSASSDEVEAG